MEKKGREGALVGHSRVATVAFCFSSPSQTLRLTPLTSALRAARAHDAVLRMYPDLPLRFIKIHGDILVSYACELVILMRNKLNYKYKYKLIYVRIQKKGRRSRRPLKSG